MSANGDTLRWRTYFAPRPVNAKATAHVFVGPPLPRSSYQSPPAALTELAETALCGADLARSIVESEERATFGVEICPLCSARSSAYQEGWEIEYDGANNTLALRLLR